MASLLARLDWDATPMGRPDTWPQSLRSALSICLEARLPIAIYWGAELALVYNEAWSSIPGDKHPWAIGKPAAEVWPDIWHIVGPDFERSLQGEAVWADDRLLPMRRHGYLEETYFNYNLSPIRGDAGGVDGVFNAGLDTTARVLGERRNHLLRELSGAMVDAVVVGDACTIAMGVLAGAPETVPFALLYSLVDDSSALELSATAVVGDDHPAAVPAVPLGEGGAPRRDPWGLRDVVRTRRATVVENLGETFGDLPMAAWPEPPRLGVVVPVFRALPYDRRVDAVLVLGVSAGRPLDREAMAFCEVVADRIGAGITSARAAEEERERYEVEHRIATTLQRSLLPATLPEIEGLEVAARYLPGGDGVEVGGDWYDVLVLPDGAVALVIGDVVGKGVVAAATMGQLRNALRAYLLEGLSPAFALERLNNLVLTLGGPSFATVLCLVTDPRSGSVRWCRAGHIPALLVDDSGSAYLEDGGSPPVGAFAGARFFEAAAVVPPGGTLVLCTDGLVESRVLSLDAGMARLARSVATAPDDLDGLLDHVLRSLEGEPQRDDVAVLVARRRGLMT